MSMILKVLIIFAAFGFQPGEATPPATPGPESPYAQEFEQARQDSTNPLQLQILSDDVITPEEYDLVVQAFLTCMHEAGYTEERIEQDRWNPAVYVYIGNPITATPGADPTEADYAAYDEQWYECTREHKSAVEALYNSITVNPDNLEWDPVILDCLHTYQLVPASFTLADLKHASVTGEWGAGVEPFSDAFATCLMNPLQIGLDPMPLPEATPASTPAS